MNAESAQKYLKYHLFVRGISLPLLGIGASLAWSAYMWAGLPMVVVGALLHRVIKAQASKIMLHLALHHA